MWLQRCQVLIDKIFKEQEEMKEQVIEKLDKYHLNGDGSGTAESGDNQKIRKTEPDHRYRY